MSIEDMVLQIQRGDAAGMGELWQRVRRFIYSICMRYQGAAEMDDLLQESYFALMAAVNDFDPEKGSSFLNYLAIWVQQGLRRYVQTLGYSIRLPVHVMERIQKYSAYCNEYRAKCGSDPPDDVAAAYMGLDGEQLARLKMDAELLKVESLDEIVKGAEDVTLMDQIPAAENFEDSLVEAVDLWQAVDDLPDDLSGIVRDHYVKEMPMAEIGRQRGLSFEQVRRKKNNALCRLRKDRRLRSEIYGESLHGSLKRFQESGESIVEHIVIRKESLFERHNETDIEKNKKHGKNQ